MRHRNPAAVAIMISMLLCLSGCDWLGMVGGLQPQPEPLRQNVEIKPGDTWTFTQRKTVTSGEETTVYTTEWTETVTAETITDLAGQTAWIFKTEGTSGAEGEAQEAFQSIDYYSQGEDNILYIHGEFIDDEEDESYESFVLAEDGGKFRTKAYPLTIGTTHEWDVTYNDGYTTGGTTEVLAIETVTVAAGTFTAAKMETRSESSYGDWTTTCTSTRWHVPEINSNAKTVYTCTNVSPEGTREWEAEYELTESSLLSRQ
jgi:hypothetical protein